MREKICEMVSVMRKAATVDDASAEKDNERLAQLATENRGLKEMLKIHHRLGVNLTDDRVMSEKSVQTNDEIEFDDIDEEDDDTASESSYPGEDNSRCSSENSVIHVKDSDSPVGTSS